MFSRDFNDVVQFSSSPPTPGLHPTTISDAFQEAALKCCDILMEMSTPVDLADRQSLLQSASTSLNSKVVSQHSSLLAPMAVDAVLEVGDYLVNGLARLSIQIYQ